MRQTLQQRAIRLTHNISFPISRIPFPRTTSFKRTGRRNIYNNIKTTASKSRYIFLHAPSIRQESNLHLLQSVQIFVSQCMLREPCMMQYNEPQSTQHESNPLLLSYRCALQNNFCPPSQCHQARYLLQLRCREHPRVTTARQEIKIGNRTNRSAINAKIIRVIAKSTDCVAGG